MNGKPSAIENISKIRMDSEANITRWIQLALMVALLELQNRLLRLLMLGEIFEGGGKLCDINVNSISM